MGSVISTNHQDDGRKNCRTQKFFGTDVVQCLEKSDCEWAMYFGQGRFCMSAYAMRLDHSTEVATTDLPVNPT